MVTTELEILDKVIIEKDNIVGIKKDTPIDINLIQYAMFSRNKNAAKFKEINLDNLDIVIRAVKGNTIPNSFDEDIFYAILHSFVKFKDILGLNYIPRTIYLTYSDLCSLLNLDTQYIIRIRNSLDKLASTSYKFINTFMYRDISCELYYDDDIKNMEANDINLDSTVIIFDNKIYNDIDIHTKKIRYFICINNKDNFNNLLTKLSLNEDNLNVKLTSILESNPLKKSHDTKEKMLKHLQEIFHEYTVKHMQVPIDEDEFFSDFRHEVYGNKITDFKVKKNTVTSTFNLINFVEYRTDEYNINEMLVEAKLNKDNYNSVKAFLENKLTGKSKYLLRIDINNYMYENIVNKVYLKHSLKYLLDFSDKTARALYTFMEYSKGKAVRKNKGLIRLNSPDLVIVDLELLAENVRLSLDPKAITNTFNILIRALEYLRSGGYIKNYITHKEKPLRLSYFNVEFHSEQRRTNPEFKPYSIKVLPKETPELELEFSEERPQKQIFDGIPEDIQSAILSIRNITEENIDALTALYRNNSNKQVIVKEELLSSSLGSLSIKAIANKINGTHNIKSISGYLYKTISDPRIYAEELDKLKLKEYDELYGARARDKIKEEEAKKNSLAKDKELEAIKLKVDREWDSLDENTKNDYIYISEKILNAKPNLIEEYKLILPKHLFAKEKLNIVYSPQIRLFFSSFVDFNNLDKYRK